VYDSSGNVVSGISNMIQAKKGINASLEIDGVSIRRESNEISDLINGVTLRLSNDSAGQSVTINVTKDYSAITRNVNNFVTQYNALMNALKDSSLKDDSISRQVMNSTRNILTSSYNNRTLTNYGLNHDKSGVLSLDSAKFESLLKNDFNTLSTTLDAMAQALDGNLKIYLDKIIPDRKETLNKQIENIDKTIENMEKNLEKLELSYRKKFYELEKTIASLQRSGDNLTQTLSKWGNSK
ncbi:MAG: flagellar filament capping protein FliD, partial [Proteobacteria bacterium]|nr:flagellar filament capping protein FliD [Pseudomonadota bacterium]